MPCALKQPALSYFSDRAVRLPAAPRLLSLSAAVFALLLSPFCHTLLSQNNPGTPIASPNAPAQQKAPPMLDPAGPQISLQNSEPLFDVAAALNSCGYDNGLSDSEPIRKSIREQIDQALLASPAARDAHDQVCLFIAQHGLSDTAQNLAQYVSLALYITPPPDLAPTVSNEDLPPDASQVIDILPALRNFARLVDLHYIWVHNRPQYDRELGSLHNSLTKMIVDTNIYLKMPAATTIGLRFLVVVEPQLDPGQTNARIYGTDYVVVVSPTAAGTIRMNEVRHTYLHFEIEPLLYARAQAIDRLQPFLKIIRDAPIDYNDRSDVVALVVECMIRAIEARTMDTGITIYKIPDGVRMIELEDATRKHNQTEQQAEAIRRKTVENDILQGYVLTGYFYNAMVRFEKQPQSFSESIGQMVYGMDVEAEVGKVKHIDFVDAAPQQDIVQRIPRRLQGLDLAQANLMKGDIDDAGKLAQQTLDQRSGDPGRANFILAQVDIMHRDVGGAQHHFEETVRLSKDPRIVAWSHIYLGRIYDVQNQRNQALTEYQAALVTRDGQDDTKRAAEKGLKQPYAVPQTTHVEQDSDDSNDSGNSDQPAPAQSAPAAQPR